MRVAIQGIAGSFHDIAARRYFGKRDPSAQIELVECETFRELFDAVESGRADAGMSAIENTIAGSILGNYSLLEQHRLHIVGEIYVRIQHHLVALPGQKLENIHTVLGHPVAIPQCHAFLDEHPWLKLEEAFDTAGAAKQIADQKLMGVAAIAGYAAADLYGLEVVAEQIEDTLHNTTRFLALSKTPNERREGLDKASISLRVSHRSGALADALNIVKYAHINLTKIQSVSVVDAPFEYAIHVDLVWEDLRDFDNAIAELNKRALETRIFGVYAHGESDLESMAKPTYARAISEPPTSKTQPANAATKMGGSWRNWGLPESARMPERLLIAGPCSAESEDQLVQTAKQLKQGGWAGALRAGIWKPRTRAGSFEGHGVPALGWLREAKRETGLPTAVEVASAAHVEACLTHGVDIMWVGARTTGNPFSVQEIADALQGTDQIVFVKNPISPDLDLWIGALERLSLVGINRLGAIHRGFSQTDRSASRNRPEWSIVLQFRHRLPDVPLICDPSHIAGRRDTLASFAQRALDLGLDGLMVEVHRDPCEAWTDAEQQITPAAYGEMLEGLTWRPINLEEEHLTVEEWNKLEILRSAVDRLDHDLLELLASRMNVVQQIGEYKRLHRLDVLQPTRWSQLMERRLAHGDKLQLNPEFVEGMFEEIHDESKRLQSELREE